MNMATRGVDVLIYVNTGSETNPTWTAIGGQRNATLTETVETIDISTKDSEWQEFEYALGTWTLSCDGIYLDNDVALEKLISALRSRAKVKVRTKEGETFTQEGLALVTSVERAAPYDDVKTYSVELQGVGPLTTPST
jgi:TP901-1 family phage major tail protein